MNSSILSVDFCPDLWYVRVKKETNSNSERSLIMTEKTKRAALIAAGLLLCAVVAVGISSRFKAAPKADDPTISDNVVETKDPVVDIKEPEVKVDIKTEPPAQTTDPGQGADSSGTDQTIQETPTKPEAPEPPKTPGQTDTDHTAEDVPKEDRNTEAPPSYEPEQTEVKPQPTEPAGGSTDSNGKVYVPGFGYIESQGEGTVIQDDSIYENGNQVGIMG